jgi:hypothetical protein
MELNNEGHRMKVTKRQLKRIIKEEKARLLREQSGGPGSGRWKVGPPDVLRGAIRDEEQRLEKRAAELFGYGIDLPSEDSVMDDPARFKDMLINAWEKLEAVSIALDEYEKAGGW